MAKSLKVEIAAYLERQMRPCTKCGVEKPFSGFSICRKETLGIRSVCKPCVSSLEASRRDPVKERERSRRRHMAAPEKTRERVKRWRKNNQERFRATEKAWREENREKVNATAKRHYEKCRKVEKYRLGASVKAMVHAKLTGRSKNKRGTFSLLGFSLDDLRGHLESQFLPGMSWDNYGRSGWHIDHKIPLAAFNYTSPDHIDFKRAWSLENLQPMWARENQSKGARLSQPFQPALAI